MRLRFSYRVFAIVFLLSCLSGTARAEEEKKLLRFHPDLDASYFYDGGMVPFVYGSLTAYLGLKFFLEPPDSPRLFPDTEGGALFNGDTVPTAWLVAYASANTLLIGGIDTGSQWYHLKGYTQSILTTLALTELSKKTFGRQRPHYPVGETPDITRSFFSGHSSMAASSTVYLGLYSHYHLIPKLRSPALKALAYAGLVLVGVGVPASRVYDNRHHLSDVVTGGLVGGTTALLFYRYQQKRFSDKEESFFARLRLAPDPVNQGIALSGTF